MNRTLKLGLILAGTILLGAAGFLLINQRSNGGETPDVGPNGPDEQILPGGMPPMRQEVREALEALFAQYNDAAPKDVIITRLEELSKELTGDKGPAAHQISVAPSTEGLHFEYRGDPDAHGFIAEKAIEGIIKHASVPDAIIDPTSSKIRLYFVDSDATRKIIAAIETLSDDTVSPTAISQLYQDGYLRDNNPFSMAEQIDDEGEAFKVKTLRIINFPEDLSAADPSIILTEDGKYRLYFFCVPTAEIPEGGDIAEAETHYIGYADSDDGQMFTYGGIAYNRKDGGLTDPEVYRFSSKYRLFLQGEKIRVAASLDGGKSFNPEEWELDLSSGDYLVGGPSIRIGEIEGEYRMYFSGAYGEIDFTASASSSDGDNWTFNPLPKIGGRGSMAPVPSPSTGYLFYFHH
jgi:hypothetical protein